MLLRRAQNKVERKTESIAVLKGPEKSFNEPQGTRVLLPDTPQKPGKGATGGDSAAKSAEGSPERGRSRNPDRTSPAEPPPLPFADKYDALECGGGGACGYLCIAAALGFDRNQTWDDMKAQLSARALTIRNDLFKHLRNDKHIAEYQSWFDAPALAGTSEQEDGAVPQNWEEWTQATLRPGRWIDGLSLLAAAKRYGICILVVPCSGDVKDRPMRFGDWRSGKDPVVLLLRKGHYQLVVVRGARASWMLWLISRRPLSLKKGLWSA